MILIFAYATYAQSVSNQTPVPCLTPEQSEAQNYLLQGFQRIREKSFQEASKSFEKSIESAPNLCAYRISSYVYRELKLYQAVADAAVKAIILSPTDSLSYHNYGTALVYLKQV